MSATKLDPTTQAAFKAGLLAKQKSLELKIAFLQQGSLADLQAELDVINQSLLAFADVESGAADISITPALAAPVSEKAIAG